MAGKKQRKITARRPQKAGTRGGALTFMSIVGARPNFMKIAPFARATERQGVRHILVHTGQHYDEAMSDRFFRDLAIKKPTINLKVGSASHAVQTATIMSLLEPHMLSIKPDVVVLVGDVNSTVAASLTAAKLGIPVAHIEAGLRSFDRSMPEEINRLVTDQLSDHLFIHEDSAQVNLMHEGFSKEKIHFVGNIMIDSLLFNLERARRLRLRHELGLADQDYALMTLHRPSNVDDPKNLQSILSAVLELQKFIPIVWPIHPRTQKQIERLKLDRQLRELENLRLLEPAGYLDFLHLMEGARFVLTDSGGIQEETTALGVDCMTARENTERPITVTHGTNVIVGTDPKKIVRYGKKLLGGYSKRGRIPKYWDGNTADRIVQILKETYA